MTISPITFFRGAKPLILLPKISDGQIQKTILKGKKEVLELCKLVSRSSDGEIQEKRFSSFEKLEKKI